MFHLLLRAPSVLRVSIKDEDCISEEIVTQQKLSEYCGGRGENVTLIFSVWGVGSALA